MEKQTAAAQAELFPARAGVILDAITISENLEAFPRACGGDPMVLFVKPCDIDLSPRVRG